MKVIGIVAEYNPFHNGHLYQIEQIKKRYPDSILIVVLSGNFTQRGIPSVIDKWKKTEIALQCGIDLVIELPYAFATQGADLFAKGAISILKHIQADTLIFGSESGDLESLFLLAKTQLEEPQFDTLVKVYIREGYNYPTALSKALEDFTGKRTDLPNDILGITYLKEIIKQQAKIDVELIQRTNSYHEETLEDDISSATAIRMALTENKDISSQVPKETLSYLTDLHFEDDYFPFLKYKILTETNLAQYQGVDEGIDHLLKKEIQSATSTDDLINRIKSKRYTYNKLRRMLNHVLCSFTKEEAREMKEIEYLRILGFTKEGRDYLNKRKKELDLPLVTVYARHPSKQLELELKTTYVYASILEEEKKNALIKDEYSKHP